MHPQVAKVLWFFLSRKNFFFAKKKQKTLGLSQIR